MEQKTLNFSITASDYFLERIKRLLSVLEYTGKIGHSAYFSVWCDGDGSDRVKIGGFETGSYYPKDKEQEEVNYADVVNCTSKGFSTKILKVYP